VNQIETFARQCLKLKKLTDSDFAEIAGKVFEAQPSTNVEMLAICREYMPANMATESNAETFAAELVEAKLLQPLTVAVVDDTKSALKKARRKEADKDADKMD
jgi:hypothetical protein